MRAKLHLAVLLAVALILAGCSRPAPWSTKSPAEQGGLKLVAVGAKMPDELAAAGLHNAGDTEGFAARAWLEVKDRSLVPADNPSAGPVFALVAGGASQRLEALLDASEKPQDGRQFLVVQIPTGYGPEFSHSTLQATLNGKTIAEWKLDAIPAPSKQIADSEPLVTKGKAMGYDVRLLGEAIYVEPRTPFDAITFSELSGTLSVAPGLEAAANKDQVEVQYSMARSTWAALPNAAALTITAPIDPSGILPLNGECVFPTSVDRVEIPLKFRRFRTLVEPLVFKNVEIVAEPGTGALRAEPDKDQTFETPSGLKITLLAGSQKLEQFMPGLHLRLSCAQGTQSVDLAKSPLCRSTGKPVSISFGGWSGGRISVLEGGVPDSQGVSAVTVPFHGPKGNGRWIVPELKLAVEQKAVLAEETLDLLLPVKAKGGKR